MGSFGIWHWLIFLFVFSIYVVPVWRIVSKAGYNGAFCLLGFIPVLNIIMLYVFAFSKWPHEKPGA